MNRALAALALPLLVVACSSDPEPSDSSSSAAAACKTVQDSVREDTSGKTLARAAEIHQPSTEEIQKSAFIYAVAIDAYQKGALDTELAQMIVDAADDPNQGSLFGGTVDTTYAELAPSCSVNKVSSPIISATYACTDDCHITVNDLAKYFGMYDAMLQALVKMAGGNAADIVMNVRSAMNSNQTSLSDAIKANLEQNEAMNMVADAGASFAGNLAVGGSVAAATGQEHVALTVDGIAGFIYFPLVSKKVVELARLIDGCRKFVAACGKITATNETTMQQQGSDPSNQQTIAVKGDVTLKAVPTPGMTGEGTLTGSAKTVVTEVYLNKCITVDAPPQHYEVPMKGTYKRAADGSIRIYFIPEKPTRALYPNNNAWTWKDTCVPDLPSIPLDSRVDLQGCVGTLKDGVFKADKIPLPPELTLKCDVKAADKTFQ